MEHSGPFCSKHTKINKAQSGFAAQQQWLAPGRGWKAKQLQILLDPWFFQVLSTYCFACVHGPSRLCAGYFSNLPKRKANSSEIISVFFRAEPSFVTCLESSSFPSSDSCSDLPHKKGAVLGQHHILAGPIRRWGWEPIQIPVAAYSHLLTPNTICSFPEPIFCFN